MKKNDSSVREKKSAADVWNSTLSFCRKYLDGNLILGILFTAASLMVLLYYIIGPSKGYFHSDCADSLLWANAILESGKILTEDFGYAALLPFGSPLWMVPVLAIFGLTMRAQIVSMAIFAILFVGTMLFFFRSMKWDWKWSAISTFIVSMLLSGSMKLREIMWEHTIYYSLGVLLLFLLLGLLFRVLNSLDEKGKRARFVIWSVLLAFISIGCGMDSFQIMVLTSVPVLGGLAAETFFDGETALFSAANKRKYYAAGLLLGGMVAGLLLYLIITKGGTISAGYENAYSGWSAMSVWQENADKFFTQYFSLLGIEITVKTSLFSLSSLVAILKLGGAMLILVCPALLLFRYRKLDRMTKIVLLAHLISSFVILFGYVCGMLSAASWRLVPFIAGSVITTLLYIRSLFTEDGMVGKRIGILLVAVLLAFALLNARSILSIPRDYGADDDVYEICDTLEEKGYSYGYATFWNAGKMTLLSNGSVRVRNINADRNGITVYTYQSMKSWYEDQEGQETYFVMLSDSEYQAVERTEYWNRLLTENPPVDSFMHSGFRFFVFEKNIF